jgi:hypothetical protein
MAEAYDIVKCWSEELAQSATLAAFCRERFGTGPHVLLGYALTSRPDERRAPWILLLPMEQDGGYEAEAEESRVLLAFGVIDSEVVTSGALTEQRGHASIKLFEEAIRQVLSATDWPPSTWGGEYVQPADDYYEAHRIYTYHETNTL